MSKGESLIKGKDAIAAAYADCYQDSFADRWELLYRAVSFGYDQAEKDLGWHSVDESLPPIDEEVIVLTDELDTAPIYKIALGHIVDKNIAVDYNGWNIPGVKYWMPCPKIPE